MKFFSYIFNNLHRVVYFCAMIIVCIGCFFLVTKEDIFSDIKTDLIAPYSFSGPIDVVFEDGTTYRKSAPFSIKTDRNFNIVLNMNNIGMIDGKALSFISRNATIRCEVDGKVIYRNFNAVNKSKYAQNNSLFLIDLPKNIKENKIILYYENDQPYSSVYELKQIKVGKRINILSDYFIHGSAFNYLILLFLLIICVSVFSTTNPFKKRTSIEKYFIYIALLTMCLFVFIVCAMPISYFILSKYTVFLQLFSYTSLMFIPVFILNAIIVRSNEKLRHQLKFAMAFASMNICIQYVLVFLNIKTFSVMANYTYFIILYVFVLIMYACIVAKTYKESRKILMVLSLSPLILGTSIESIMGILKGFIVFSNFFKLGVFGFGVFQCYEFFSFYISDRDKKIKTELYQKLAFFDRLTEVGNRLSLSEKRVDYKKEKGSFYIILMDIDNLKYINDQYGHKYGDHIIALLSKYLKEGLDPKYKKDIFRIGGDEFVVVYHAPKSIDIQTQLSTLAIKYQNTRIKNMRKNQFGVSYGYCFCDIGSGDEFGKAMHAADRNMYKDKELKKRNYVAKR